jgi:hypothetical protein
VVRNSKTAAKTKTVRYVAHNRVAATTATSSAMRDRIALHEASHSIVARALALHCGGATVADDHGRANYQDTTDDSIANIITHMSGSAAERVLLGDIADGHVADQQAVALLCARRDMTQAQLDKLWSTACTLVRANENAIRCVAQALLEHGELSGEEIDAIVWPR